MHFIVISILCSVSVSVLFKLATGWRLDLRQVIAGGYLVAIVIAWLLFQPTTAILNLPWDSRAWLVLALLGFLMPSLFFVFAISVKKAGMVATDAAQRLSLLIPLIAAFTLFGEHLSVIKVVGLAVGLIAIAAIVSRPRQTNQTPAWQQVSWLLVVFVGMGAVDILYKTMAQIVTVPFTEVLFATFVVSFFWALLYVGWLYARNKTHWQSSNLWAAMLLGILNFGNIYFYVLAHQHLANSPSLVFSSMNIGVIVLATLIGASCFRERLSYWNWAGLALAVVAIGVLA